MGNLLLGINLVALLEGVCFEFQLKKGFKDSMSFSSDALKYLFCFFFYGMETPPKICQISQEGGIDQGVHKGTFQSNEEEMKSFLTEIFHVY